ncbi:MAG: nucleotidyltransferase domain-containing protein [Clostridia bacterium]|jgi:predicted nucleotidyltransferase|nr:nucleotidyltransferase domain-containing protein [Clostridia bacterium]MDH7572839.1 nucleotidyltransferase domain-containing protein [Clostridia bacterium]
MSELGKILEAKQRRKARLDRALAELCSQLRELGALKIILFGSMVRNETDVDSDLDLLVVMPATRRGKEWGRMVYERVECAVASDILVYNERELQEELPVNSFLQEILAFGRALE